jgi:hypothetical protein
MGITVADGMRLGMGLILDGIALVLIVVAIGWFVAVLDNENGRWF